MVGAATAASHISWENQLLLLLCAYRYFHDEEKSYGVPSLGGISAKLWTEDLHETVVLIPVCSDCFCPQEKWWEPGWIFQTNRQSFSSVCCIIFWVFGARTCPETAGLLTASLFLDHIDRFKFHHQPALAISILNSLHWTFTTILCTTQPYLIIVCLSANGESACMLFLTQRRLCNMDVVTAVLMLGHS